MKEQSLMSLWFGNFTRIQVRAATSAALVATVLAAACETDGPTAIDEVLVDALAGPEAAADGGESGNPVAGALRITSAREDGAQPLIFIDEVEVVGSGGLRHPSLRSLDPDDIDRIEIVKGEAAVVLFGDRGERGVIQIYTKGS